MAQFTQLKFSFRPFLLAWVVSTLDSAINWINHYPADKYLGNQLRYPADNIIHFLNNWGQMFPVTNLQS